MSLVEARAYAESCHIPAEDVPVCLRFLHRMSVLMWHEEDTLRDVIVLDAIKYFVKPITAVICKHNATSDDSTRHFKEAS